MEYLVPSSMETYGVQVLLKHLLGVRCCFFQSLGTTTQVFKTFGGDKHCGGSQHEPVGKPQDPWVIFSTNEELHVFS